MGGEPPTSSGLYFAVKNMARTVAFYRDLGFDIPDGAETKIHVTLRLGEGVGVAFGTLQLTRGYNPEWLEAVEGSPNALRSDLPTRNDVDKTYQRMIGHGHTGSLAPIDAFWGSRYAEIQDPDGNVLGFHSPADPAKAGPPPL